MPPLFHGRQHPEKGEQLMVKCARGLLVSGILLVAAPLMAQIGMRPPQFNGIWSPVVGSGATYETTGSDGNKNQMTIAVVSKEDVDGKTGYWMEMAFSGRDAQTTYTQVLMVLDGAQTHIEKMVLQMPGRPPMEMPMEMMKGAQRQATPADVRQDAEKVGTESVTTPAGSFDCEHWRTRNGQDVWVSPKITPWGLVKTSGGSASMTLTKVITDAKSHITGTPQKFDFSQMGRGRGQ